MKMSVKGFHVEHNANLGRHKEKQEAKKLGG